jgi:hypothetical protein
VLVSLFLCDILALVDGDILAQGLIKLIEYSFLYFFLNLEDEIIFKGGRICNTHFVIC